MEDWLEKHRFSARFNAGESGHHPQTLESLLNGLQPDFGFSLRDALLSTELCDAPNLGLEDLRSAVASMHPGASPENVLITTGTSEALVLLLRQLRPRRLALIVPAFQLLLEIPRSLGAEIVPLPIDWTENGEPLAPLNTWIETITRECPDVLLINHPHNPSGLVFTQAELDAMQTAAENVGCTVVGDEHYRLLARSDGTLGPTAFAPGRFVTGSFIKCAGTPGLRIGWCVGAPSTLQAMQSEKNYLTHTVSPISQSLALWFLQSYFSGNRFFAELHGEWMQNRLILGEWLQRQSEWIGSPPQGGLVTCLFPSDHPADIEHFTDLRNKGVFLLPLSTFSDSICPAGRWSTGFRVGLGLRPHNFESMLSVMVPNNWR
jgi:N-succinyldiaminopimelate aminotransferase